MPKRLKVRGEFGEMPVAGAGMPIGFSWRHFHHFACGTNGRRMLTQTLVDQVFQLGACQRDRRKCKHRTRLVMERLLSLTSAKRAPNDQTLTGQNSRALCDQIQEPKGDALAIPKLLSQWHGYERQL
jgi:hypothetical protein